MSRVDLPTLGRPTSATSPDLHRQALRPEAVGEQGAEGGGDQRVPGLAGAQDLQVGAPGELAQDLAAGPAGGDRVGAVAGDGDGQEVAGAGGHGGHHRRPLGADGQAVAGVLDVGGGDHVALGGEQRRPDPEPGVGGVGAVAGGPCGGDQLGGGWPVHCRRAWAAMSVADSGGGSRWMRTRPMRRPWTRSARSRSPWNSTSWPSRGTPPTRLNSSPPIVSHSVAGSVDVEQLVDLVDAEAGVDPVVAVGQRLDVGLLAVVLVGDLPDDLLQQVLQGDQAGGAAVLVDHDHHVALAQAHLAQALGGPHRLGHVGGRAQDVGQGLVGLAVVEAPEHVLGVGQAHHLVDGAVVDRDAREAGAQDQLEHLLERGLEGHGDHVGPGHHDLAQDGVAELEDRVDHLPLFLFDDVVPLGLVDHGLDLVLGHERAALQALAGGDHVADGDQQPGELPEAGEAGEEVHERGHEQRRPVGVLDGVGLGRHLGADEGDHGHDGGRDDHPEPAADEPVHHRGEQGGGEELDHQHQQQDQVEEPGRLLDQGQELGGAAALLLAQVHGPGPAHAGQAGLGRGQEGGDPGQHGHRQQAPDVGGGQLVQVHGRSPARQAASSSLVRVCMARSSSGSAWSNPHRWRMPCTVSSSSSAVRLWPLRVACSAA